MKEILKLSEENNDHQQSLKRKRNENNDVIRMAKRRALIDDIVKELITPVKNLNTNEKQSEEVMGVMGIWNEFNKAVVSENNGIEYWYRYAEKFRKEIKERGEK